MQFSVIIPVYNRRELIDATLESVLAQTIHDYELIVVDDGSTDGTTDYIRHNFPQARVYAQANSGPGAARNRGAANSRGDYLVFLDSDDLFFPWALQVLAQAIAEQEAEFICGTACYFERENELLNVQYSEPQYVTFDDYLSSFSEWRFRGAGSMAVKRETFLSVAGFVEDRLNGEDCDLALKLGLAKGFVHIESPPTFAYRQHPGSLTKQVKATAAGAGMMIHHERVGNYPGDASRQKHREVILARHLRPLILDLARAGAFGSSLKFFCQTFRWNISDRRWRFLLGYPPFVLSKCLESVLKRRNKGS